MAILSEDAGGAVYGKRLTAGRGDLAQPRQRASVRPGGPVRGVVFVAFDYMASGPRKAYIARLR